MEERIYQESQQEYPEYYNQEEMVPPEYQQEYSDIAQNIPEPEYMPEYIPEYIQNDIPEQTLDPYTPQPNIQSQEPSQPAYFNNPPYTAPMPPNTQQDYMNDYHRLHNNNTEKVAIKEKLKINNEKFVMIALLASVVLTSVIIGIGWSLFSPNPDNFAIDTKNTATEKSDANVINGTDDLVIVYGTKSNENQIITPAQTTVQTPTIKKSIPVRTTPKKPIVKTAPLSSSTIAGNSTTKTKVVKKSISTATRIFYWIQIFATTNKDRALQIKKEFENRGITPSIITKTINNNVYYRVRIGPYFNKAESNKFLQWVKENASYQDAYISTIKK